MIRHRGTKSIKAGIILACEFVDIRTIPDDANLYSLEHAYGVPRRIIDTDDSSYNFFGSLITINPIKMVKANEDYDLYDPLERNMYDSVKIHSWCRAEIDRDYGKYDIDTCKLPFYTAVSFNDVYEWLKNKQLEYDCLKNK